jgi:predicted AlkP superfamily phosphohydrolase/phosphomutase
MAYIGPGAGIAIGGSFLVMFVAIVSSIFILLTWPIRAAIKFIRFRKIVRRSRIKKAVVLGFDGMDYSLTKKWMEQGKLPNFSRLCEHGSFKPLASTIPPISPVAWSSFQTGVNPGKHNIFDFLTRDKKRYSAKLSSTEIHAPVRHLSFGKYKIPLGSADIRLLRKGVPFWKILGDHGVFSSVIRVPITFPPEKFKGIQLSAMCVPDLRGTQGTFSHFTTSPSAVENTGGESYLVHQKGCEIRGELIGPEDSTLRAKTNLTCPFTIELKGEQDAVLKVGGESVNLTVGTYSGWIQVTFKSSLKMKVSGICRFLLLSTDPEFHLYVTPINIDPEKPVMPISHPRIYSTYLAKKQGPFATLGLAEDSWALNEKIIKNEDFLQQALDGDREREKMLFDSLDHVKQGLCVCVFDGTDRVQHTFWRQMEDDDPRDSLASRTAIEDVYKRADSIVGKVLDQYQKKDTLLMVVSDHGFKSFRRGVDLNCWLEENGYLTLKSPDRGKENLSNVDWSQTRAFALGLSGIFLNIKGREAQGIVDSKTEASHLRTEIAEKLADLKDVDKQCPAVKQVYDTQRVYTGPFKTEAPDLIVGYCAGYRASWETAVGKITDRVFHDNTKAWSGDHCIDQSLVPGILFCNRNIDAEAPRLMDIGPTVLDLFGVEVPRHMDGRPLKVSACGEVK